MKVALTTVRGVLETVHGDWVHGRRTRVLSQHLSEVVPRTGTVLDVGCGDGLIGSLLQAKRPDLDVSGIDIAVRKGGSQIPVGEFDGLSIPFDPGSVDVVVLVDVLHHAAEPLTLLSEAARVARRAIVLKDVTPLGPLSDTTLRFMDWVGNARHGVPLPYRFWSQDEWRVAFEELGLRVDEDRRRLALYPLPWNLIFEKRMHFIVRLRASD